METKYYTLNDKEELLKHFLIVPRDFETFINTKQRVIWIYKIIRISDEKPYIGRTTDIRRRAFNYINEYLKGDGNRKINKAINNDGLENFRMIPLEIALNEDSAAIKEKYYIDLYDSIKKGFNTAMNSARPVKKRKRPSVPHTLYSKVIKSKLECSINISDKKIIFSTGLKLFGDYIGRHKDEIKSAAKRQTKLDGYFIYYLNKSDFSEQMSNAKLKIEKNTTYSDYKLQYNDFVKYGEYLLSILKDNKNPENFEILFITQSNDSCGYKYENPDKFMKYYSRVSNSIV